MRHDNGIMFARLLCELVANNESLNLEVVADEMDLDLAEVKAIFEDAHDLWEGTKICEVNHLDRVRQVVTTCALTDSHMGVADVAAELRVLADTLDGGAR